MLDRVTSAFRARFTRTPAIVVRAPGRVNLLGGHTDYNDGYVLPVAVDRSAWIAAAPLREREARLRAVDLQYDTIIQLDSTPGSDGGWADYPRGVVWALQERGFRLAGMEAVLTSDVPVGAGLSSSAAVLVSLAYTWQQLSGFQLSRRDLALACQQAENDYIGVKCGIMDQLTSALAAKDYALLLDCRTLDVMPVPLPAGTSIVVADTGIRRQLAVSEYNTRRSQCEQAVRILSPHLPEVTALRDVSPDDLERYREQLPELTYRRARHVVTDNVRVLQAAEALRQEDVATVGALMKACHISLRDDYEVSCPELDQLAAAAWEVEGCHGARLTGAGFGGCIVALVAAGAVPEFEAHVSGVYQATFGRQPVVYACQSADGATRVI